MKITLANGQIFNLQNAPEDITQEEVLMALKKTDPDLYKMQLNSLAKTGADSSALAKDTGPVDAAMIAAGGATDSLLSGVKGLFSDDNTNVLTGGTADDRRSIMAPLEEERPVATALGSILPYMAVPTAGMAGAGTGLVGRTLGSQGLKTAGTALQGGKALLADAVVGGTALGAIDQDSTALEGGAGGLLGVAAPQVVSKTMRGLTKHAPDVKGVINWALDKGFDFPPGVRTGGAVGDVMRKVEAGLESKPWTSKPPAAMRRNNWKAANKVVNEAIGESGDHISMANVNRAHNRIGDEFDRLAGEIDRRGGLRIDNTVMNQIDAIEKSAEFRWIEIDKSVPKILDKIRDDFYSGELVSGAEFQRAVSGLGKKARSLATSGQGDRNASIALMQTVTALDDLMGRSLGREHQAAYKLARNRWKDLMSIEAGQVVKADGNVSLPKLANILRKKDPAGYKRGENVTDLYQAARIGDIPELHRIVGESGTPAGSFSIVKPMVKGTVYGGALGGIVGGAPGSAVGAGLGLVGGLLSPPASALGSSVYHASRNVPRFLDKSSGMLGRIGASTGGPDEERLRGLLGR